MHEMSLCRSILETLREQARLQHFTRVERVCLEIGPFAGVEVQALRFGFDAVTRGSLAADARLEIVEQPGEAWCRPCAATVPIVERFDPCPRCGGHELIVTAGEALRIKELEVA